MTSKRYSFHETFVWTVQPENGGGSGCLSLSMTSLMRPSTSVADVVVVNRDDFTTWPWNTGTSDTARAQAVRGRGAGPSGESTTGGDAPLMVSTREPEPSMQGDAAADDMCGVPAIPTAPPLEGVASLQRNMVLRRGMPSPTIGDAAIRPCTLCRADTGVDGPDMWPSHDLERRCSAERRNGR